jgi:hypothetical protein
MARNSSSRFYFARKLLLIVQVRFQLICWSVDKAVFFSGELAQTIDQESNVIFRNMSLRMEVVFWH